MTRSVKNNWHLYKVIWMLLGVALKHLMFFPVHFICEFLRLG